MRHSPLGICIQIQFSGFVPKYCRQAWQAGHATGDNIIGRRHISESHAKQRFMFQSDTMSISSYCPDLSVIVDETLQAKPPPRGRASSSALHLLVIEIA